MIPLFDTAPRARPAAVVLVLIGLNVLALLWLSGLPPRAVPAALAHLAVIPVQFTHPWAAARIGLGPGSYTQLATNLFLHGGWLHLISNMWFLWIFGPAMEARLGRLGFLGLFLAGGVAANIVHIWSDPTSPVPVIGASGAVAAVVAAYAVTYPKARVVTLIPIGFIPFFWPLSALIFAGVWFGLQVLQATSEALVPGMAAGVAWWAHIGGFAFGAVVAWVLKRNGPVLHTATTRHAELRGRRVPDVRTRTWR